MLFVVIEHFKQGPAPIGERFAAKGRMMPPDVAYVSSWLEESGDRCWQLMEAPNLEAFQDWTRNWDDLMDFEIVPVLTSQEFWKRRGDGPA